MPDPFPFPSSEAAIHLADQNEATMAALGRQTAAFYVAFYGTLIARGVPVRVATVMLQRQQVTDLQCRLQQQAPAR